MKARSWLYSLFAILLAFSLVATACGNDDDDPGAGDTPSAPSDDSGDGAADDDGDDMADDSGDGAADDDGDDMADDSGDGAADDAGDGPADDAVVMEEIGPPEDTVVTVCDAPSFTQIYAKVMSNRGFAENRGFEIDFVACHSGPAQGGGAGLRPG